MPSILKSLFKSTLPSRSKPSRHPQPLSPGAFSDFDRSSTYSTEDLTQLTAQLARSLASHTSDPADQARSRKDSKSKGKSKDKLKKPKSRGAFADALHPAIQAIEAGNVSRIDPYYPSQSQVYPPQGHTGPSTHQGASSSYHTQAVPSPAQASFIPPKYAASQPSAGDEWSLAFQCCSAALASAEHLAQQRSLLPRRKKLADRCVSLLDAQRDELFAMRPWAEDKQLPMFRTLTQVYNEIINALDQVTPDNQHDIHGLLTVVQVLQEGPDYLIDIGLVECIIWQSEVIDPAYGADIRNLLDDAVAAQVGLVEFRRRLEVMIEVALAPPAGAVDNDLGRDALDAIRRFVKQLESRIGAHTANPFEFSTAPLPPTLSTPTPSPPASSSGSSSPATHTPHNAQTLQQTYGTGPLPPVSHPSPYPTRRAPSPTPSSTSTSSSQKSIFEYRGHRLTRSALELVQTQERLATADSSGQYAGEVSWDDLRNAWVPKWAEKLRSDEVADGEVPDTNPANFREKKKDAWGNRIGWYEGRMYYEEEPNFDLR